MNKIFKMGIISSIFTLTQMQATLAQESGKMNLESDKTEFNQLDSERPGTPNKGGQIIPGSYIVVFNSKEEFLHGMKPEFAERFVDSEIKALQANYKFEVQFKYTACLHGFSAKMTKAEAELMAKDQRVESIESDRVVVLEAQSLPTGMIRIGGDKSSTIVGDNQGKVEGVDVYIIDTGIDFNHPDLNVVGGKNFSTGTSYADPHGHGTHVAGIVGAKDNDQFVVGAAPGVNLYAVRVLNASGSGSYSTILAGVNWVTAQKNLTPQRPAVANMSLGGYTGTTYYNSLDRGIKNSIAAGVVYAIAAGNSTRNAKYYSPAHVTEALTIGAYNGSTNRWASFSNYGSIVDILAPGVNVLSTYKGSSTATMSGTSMASPHVAGAAALYLSQHTGDSPAMVRTALMNASLSPVPGPNPLILGVPTGTTKNSVYEGNF